MTQNWLNAEFFGPKRYKRLLEVEKSHQCVLLISNIYVLLQRYKGLTTALSDSDELEQRRAEATGWPRSNSTESDKAAVSPSHLPKSKNISYLC